MWFKSCVGILSAMHTGVAACCLSARSPRPHSNLLCVAWQNLTRNAGCAGQQRAQRWARAASRSWTSCTLIGQIHRACTS